MPPIQLTTPSALWGLLLLVPIIILYLIKPKPKRIRFPSIMFIRGVEKSKRFRSFFKKFIRDPLFIIQIIIVILLVLAITGPFLFVQEEENIKENAVLILDASASMQSTDITPSRFHKAREIAGDLIDAMNKESRVSIVLAENVPILLSRNLDKEAAKHAIDNAFSSDTPTNIGDAILFSRDILPKDGVNKKIYVFSDLSPGEGTDLRLAQGIASQEGINVNLVKINEGGGNIGIIDINARRFITNRHRFHLTFTIRNLYDRDKEVEAEILNGDESLAFMKKWITPNSEKLFSYEGSGGEAKEITVRLTGKDHLLADNTAFTLLPEVKKHRVLLITADGSDLYLKYALESSNDMELTTAVLPVIPEFSGFDVIILGELKKDLILPGTFMDLDTFIQNGGHVIFLASSGLCSIKNMHMNELLPVEIDSLNTGEEKIQVQLDHEILTDVGFTNIITKKHIQCRIKNSSEVIAKIGDSPAIAHQRHGKGKVAFIGINPAVNWSNFYHSSSFPIFWLQLINWMTRGESLGVNNFRTGDYLPVEGAEVKTPSGKKATVNIILDETGFYEIKYGDRIDRIAVSLVNEKESNISSVMQIETTSDPKTKRILTVKKDMCPYIIALIILFFFIEAFYYKKRGMLTN